MDNTGAPKHEHVEALLDAVYEVLYSAIGLEECFNPSSYAIDADDLQRLRSAYFAAGGDM